MDDKVIMIFKFGTEDKGRDIEVPVNISASELIYALNQGFHLGINMDDPAECYLRTENPIALIRGDEILENYGLRNGTILYFER